MKTTAMAIFVDYGGDPRVEEHRDRGAATDEVRAQQEGDEPHKALVVYIYKGQLHVDYHT